MFGKRQTPVQNPTLETVIVPRSAVEKASAPGKGYELVAAVVNFVNAMMREGQYHRFEIPSKAVEAYHCDYYLAQVSNGGHPQFIHNCGRNLRYAMTDIPGGLAGMNAEAYLAIFKELAGFLAKFPYTPGTWQCPEEERNTLLHRLDKQFYAILKTSPMSELSALWIRSWPELRILDDAEARKAISETALMNPAREARLLAHSVGALTHQMTDRLHVGAGLACANANPTEMMLALGFGAAMEIEGQKTPCFHLRTHIAQRICVVAETHAAIYECIQANNPPMPKIGDVEGALAAIKDGRMAAYKGPTAGRKLSQVSAELIAAIVKLANECQAPAALDFLLRGARIETKGAKIAPVSIKKRAEGAVVHWIMSAGRQPLFAITGPQQSELWTAGDNRRLGIAERDEIADHAVRAASGAVKLD